MKIKCICGTCKKTFYEKPARIKDGRGKFCSKKCYVKWQTGREKFPRKERFMKYVKKSGKCWLWTGYRMPNGYALFGIGERKHPMRLAHRCSYTMFIGPIPKDKLVLHKCDIRHCVKPKHLWIGTQQDNMDDMNRKGRRVRKGSKGEEHPRAKLTESDIFKIREMYIPRKFSLIKVAKLFGINHTHVHRIVHGISWKHI